MRNHRQAEDEKGSFGGPVCAPRLASPADLPELLRLESLSFTGDRVSRRSFQRWLKRSNNLIVVQPDHLDPRRLQAYALVLFHYRGRVARIYSLAVDPEWRGRGLGQRLIGFCTQQAQQRGYRELRLEVSAGNAAALRLYRKAGFADFGERSNYYQDGSDAILLRTSI
jgi:ribosomal protein S18 acetylase RimI-like enzyme